MKVGVASVETPYDEVVDEVTGRLERQQVRRCLDILTEVQRRGRDARVHQGHSYREVGRSARDPAAT